MPKENKKTELNDELSPELMEKRDLIARILASANIDEAENKYRIGVEVAAIGKDRKRYGTSGVAMIAKAVSCTTALLYSYGTVAATWTQASFDALIERKDSNGQPLSFSHLIALAGVKDEKNRLWLTEKALNEGLSVRELANACRPTKRDAVDLNSLKRSSTSVVKTAEKNLKALREIVTPGSSTEASGETVKLFLEDCQRVQQQFNELEQLAMGLLEQPVQPEAAE